MHAATTEKIIPLPGVPGTVPGTTIIPGTATTVQR